MVMVAAEEQQFHVLAVDDSLLDRKLIERLLRTSSYQVTTVDSGSKALEFLGFLEEEGSKPNQPCVSPNNQIEQQQISLSPKKKDVGVNLIITDYCMPEMTGYDLLKKIKESSSLRNIPVVIMSSENIPSRISRCLEEGAEEFLLKPVRLSDVSKLKPHLLRTKYVGEEQEILNQLNEGHDDLQVALIAPQQKQKQQQQLQLQQQLQQQPDAQHEKQQIKQDQQNNNKRKSSEEGISVERTSHRYSGLNYCSLT